MEPLLGCAALSQGGHRGDKSSCLENIPPDFVILPVAQLRAATVWYFEMHFFTDQSVCLVGA